MKIWREEDLDAAGGVIGHYERNVAVDKAEHGIEHFARTTLKQRSSSPSDVREA